MSTIDEANPEGSESGAEYGWSSRGYLRHLDFPGAVQHVVLQLADGLPVAVHRKFERRLRYVPDELRSEELQALIDRYLDSGHGSCVLRNPEAASLVENALLFGDGERYRMLAWVVMPNHVHVLIEPKDGWTVGRIVRTWKTFTGRRLANAAGLSEESDTKGVWNREYFDRYVRDSGHFESVRRYIERNPVDAGLVARAEEWRWSSAWIGRAARGPTTG